MNLNELRDKAYKTACDNGFHDVELSNEHWIMLVITELSEAVEADRKGKHVDMESIQEAIDSDCFCAGFFEDYIKDTVEDELADAAIRLLDLAGLRNLNLNRFALVDVVSRKKTFTNNVYSIVKDITNYKYSLEEQINYAITQVFALSEIMEFDLLWHIEQKMKYNETRGYKHGKEY